MNALKEAQALAADIKRGMDELRTLTEKAKIASEALAVLKSELARRDFTRKAIV